MQPTKVSAAGAQYSSSSPYTLAIEILSALPKDTTQCVGVISQACTLSTVPQKTDVFVYVYVYVFLINHFSEQITKRGPEDKPQNR